MENETGRPYAGKRRLEGRGVTEECRRNTTWVDVWAKRGHEEKGLNKVALDAMIVAMPELAGFLPLFRKGTVTRLEVEGVEEGMPFVHRITAIPGVTSPRTDPK